MAFFSQNGSLFDQNSEQFDFNIGFEQIFFSIVPSLLFIVGASWRTAFLTKKPTIVNTSASRFVKVVCILTSFLHTSIVPC